MKAYQVYVCEWSAGHVTYSARTYFLSKKSADEQAAKYEAALKVLMLKDAGVEVVEIEVCP